MASSSSFSPPSSDITRTQPNPYGHLKPLICLQPPAPSSNSSSSESPPSELSPPSHKFQHQGNSNSSDTIIIIQGSDQKIRNHNDDPFESPLNLSSISTTVSATNGFISNGLQSPTDFSIPFQHSHTISQGQLGDQVHLGLQDQADDDEEEGAQYAAPMDDPFAEVEHGWRRMSESIPRAPNHNQPHSSFVVEPHRSYFSTSSEPRSLSTSVLLPHSTSSHNPTSFDRSACALTRNEEVLDQLNGFSFTCSNPNSLSSQTEKLGDSGLTDNHHSHLSHLNTRKLSLQALGSNKISDLAMNLGMRRSEQVGLFRPLSSSMASKTSFSAAELNSNRARLPSFSTELEPICGSPTSPSSAFSFSESQKPYASLSNNTNSAPPRSSLSAPSWRLAPQSSASSSSIGSSSADGLLRRASSSSLASVCSITSSSTNGIKARRGLNKPLSLAVPNQSRSNNLAPVIATPILSKHVNSERSCEMTAFRSLPPSPRLASSIEYDNSREQLVGMRANVTGGLSMKKRTSIPRLSLGAVSSAHTGNTGMARSIDPVRLIGRNPESSVLNTPSRLCFDPIAANAGRHELMSSQAGVGGRGHIERPEDLTELYPYEHGPREILPDVYLGSEQNARDGTLLSNMGFGLVINVAKEVECPWVAVEGTPPSGNESTKSSACGRGLLVRPTASTPNLKRSYEGKILKGHSTRLALPDGESNGSPIASSSNLIQVRRFEADPKSGRPCLDYVKLPWSHDQDGLSEVFRSSSIFTLIDRAREEKKKTLIHCQCGVSRSATLMIGYCMREALSNQSNIFDPTKAGRMHEAYSFVKEKSPWAGPNMGLIYQLIEYEKFLTGGRRKESLADEDVEEDDEEEVEEDEEGEERSSSNSNSDYEDRFQVTMNKGDDEDVVVMIVEESGMRTPRL